MGHRTTFNPEWELKKAPKAPKSIRADGIKGFLGVISPSKMMKMNVIGDEEVRQYTWDIRKYLNYRRMTTKHEWKVFHRALRWEKRRKEAQKDVREFETR